MRTVVTSIMLLGACGRIGFDGFSSPGNRDGASGEGTNGEGPVGDDASVDSALIDSSIDAAIDALVDASMVQCADFDLGNAPGMSGPYMAFGNTTSACGGGGPDTSFAWQAPASGSYTFDLCNSASNFDSVLYAYDGNTCGGTMSGCADNECGDGNNAILSLALSAGERIVIIVDGKVPPNANAFSSGNFILRIQ